jgi:hypothetical protein
MSSALRTRRHAGSSPVRKANHQRVGEPGRLYLPWKQGIGGSNPPALTMRPLITQISAAGVNVAIQVNAGSLHGRAPRRSVFTDNEAPDRRSYVRPSKISDEPRKCRLPLEGRGRRFESCRLVSINRSSVGQSARPDLRPHVRPVVFEGFRLRPIN